MQACRFCLQQCETNERLQDRNFREKAQDILSLLITVSGEEGSLAACDFCESRINHFYTFKHQCRQQEEIRKDPDRKTLSKGFAVKVEDPDGTSAKGRKTGRRIKEEPAPSPEVHNYARGFDEGEPEPDEDAYFSDVDSKAFIAKIEPDQYELPPEAAPKKPKKATKPKKRTKKIKTEPDVDGDDDGLAPVKFKLKKLKKRIGRKRELVRFTKEQLASYTKKELYADRRNTVCEECGKRVPDAGREAHMNRHRGVRPYVCNVQDCGLSFYDGNALKGHSIRIHTNGHFPCEKCGKVLPSEQSRKAHLRLHLEHHLKCEICGLTARTKMNMHMRVHTQQRDYKCPHCPKAFYASTVLTLHVRSHTGEKPYVCHICQCAYAHRILYVKHMQKFHPEAEIYKLADMPKLAAATAAAETVAAEEETTGTIVEYVEEEEDEDVEPTYTVDKIEIVNGYQLDEVDLQMN